MCELAIRVGSDQTHSTEPQLHDYVTELHQHGLVCRDGTRHLQVETRLELKRESTGVNWTVRNVQLGEYEGNS
jgi:hypothetical protein